MKTVNRRDFLAQAAALTGASWLPFSNSARAEPPPETKRIRLIRDDSICLAPLFLAAELLRLEGFMQVEYVRQNYDEYPTQALHGHWICDHRQRRTAMKLILKLLTALSMLLLIHVPIARAHWPNQAPHQFADLGEFEFELGGSIQNLRMSYVTHGKLSAAKDNAILFIHGFAANHHLFDHMIGPGQALDTDKYFVICPDALGATQTGYDHSSSPTNSGLKMKFPQYNGRDRNKAQHKLITEKLGIFHLLMVTGISSGADDSVQFAVTYPDFMDSIVPLVGGGLWTSQGYFFNPLMSSIIESCEGWQEGSYDKNPAICATNGLSPLIPFFYTREWWDEYIDAPEAYDRWRKNWGAFYLDVQDARDLYYRIHAEDAGWVGDSPGFNNDLNAVLGSIKAKTLFIYSQRDQFYVPKQIETLTKATPGARSLAIDSPAGHLVAANGDPNATYTISEAFKSFLKELKK